MLAAAGAQGTVETPVTGDEPEVGACVADGRLAATTGDGFVKSVAGVGRVSNVPRFENPPVLTMRVDAAGALDRAGASPRCSTRADGRYAIFRRRSRRCRPYAAFAAVVRQGGLS